MELACEPDLESGLARLAREPFHAVLLGLHLPGNLCLEAVRRVRDIAPDTAILVLNGLEDDELALSAVQAGAQDYLLKGQVNGALLERAIRYAIERMRIEAAQKHRASELEALYQTSLEINAQFELSTVLNSIVERAARLVDVPMGGLYLLDPDSDPGAGHGRLILTVGYGRIREYIGTVLQLGEGLSGQVALTGQPMAVDDYQTWKDRSPQFENSGIRCVLAVPLKIQGRVIGVINVNDERSRRSFSEEEIRLVSLFADQAAIVVEKARLLEAERQKSMELERANRLIAALNQVAGHLQTIMDPIQVMETVGKELLKLGVHLQIAMLSPDNNELVVRYTAVDAKAVAETEAQLGATFQGLRVGERVNHPLSMLDSRAPHFQADMVPMFAGMVPSPAAVDFEAALPRVGISHRTSGIHLPMFAKDRPFGALLAWGDEIYENDLPAFTVFANQVAAALENARLYNEIQKLAIMDELTGLYNRRGFFALAQQQIHLAHRANKMLLLIFADIDGMKEINDTLGHRQGDQALMDAARVLKMTYRTADIIARMGGDEFAILAMLSDRPETGPLAKRLGEQVAEFNATHQRPYELSLSMGTAAWPPGKLANLDDLLSRADARMYIEKRNKKERP